MKRLLVVIIFLILVSGGLAGCASAESEVSPLTTTPTSAPETAPDVVPASAPETAPDVVPASALETAPDVVPASAPETAPDVVAEKVNDIETIMGRAERLGIKVQSIVHAGSSIDVTCQAEDYVTFRKYLTALEESGRFATSIPPPEGYPYTTGGSITLEPKYQYIDMPAVYEEVNLALAPLAVPDALNMIVSIAKESGIDVDPSSSKFRIPAPSQPRTQKMGEGTYWILSFDRINAQGDYDDVMAFIADLDSGKTLETMVLKRVEVSQVEVDSKIETRAIVDVDIYTIES